jgi:hypothetical protein
MPRYPSINRLARSEYCEEATLCSLRSGHWVALNAFVTPAPFRAGEWDGAPSPADEFAAFRNGSVSV